MYWSTLSVPINLARTMESCVRLHPNPPAQHLRTNRTVLNSTNLTVHTVILKKCYGRVVITELHAPLHARA